MSKPCLVDLFCGAGGASRGYQLAGFHVTGVDLVESPRYAGDEFVQADALEFPLDGFDVIHASPPCQARTTMSNRWRGAGGFADQHINLIPETVRLLEKSGRPWVCENVPGARVDLPNAFTLTGGMFGMEELHRPRLFGSNMLIMCPPKARPPRQALGVYGKCPDGRLLWRRQDGSEQRAPASLEEAQEAMGIDWMMWDELREAIPPVYSEFIGEQLIDAIARAA